MSDEEEQKFIKCVVVGDGSVGKTCMLMSYATNKFPSEYVPTVFDNYAVTVTVREQQFQLGLFDTAGQEEYQGLRLLSYPGTHVFLFTFSITMPESLSNLELQWIPEIRHQVPDAAFLIVGTQVDLRDDEKTRQKLQKRRMKPVSYEEGLRLAKKVEADGYVECSALTKQGLKDVFDEALIVVLDPRVSRKSRGKRFKCSIL